MTPRDVNERLAIGAISFILGAALGGLIAGVLWPWLGPMLIQPCPLPSVAGVWVCAGYSAVAAALKGIK